MKILFRLHGGSEPSDRQVEHRRLVMDSGELARGDDSPHLSEQRLNGNCVLVQIRSMVRCKGLCMDPEIVIYVTICLSMH
jgi:hypothetical protein